jgi:hypothetical protein
MHQFHILDFLAVCIDLPAEYSTFENCPGQASLFASLMFVLIVLFPSSYWLNLAEHLPRITRALGYYSGIVKNKSFV